MLTDIFSRRYADHSIWTDFDAPERRLLVQSFRLVTEQVCSPVDHSSWDDLHNRLTTELGVVRLAEPTYRYALGSRHLNSYDVCERWMYQPFGHRDDADEFMKERLSLLELAFRRKGTQVATENARLEFEISNYANSLAAAGRTDVTGGALLKARNAKLNTAYQSAVQELNERLRQARVRLHYHNGFIQQTDDALSVDQIEEPFWSVVAGGRWANVDTDMKEALDQRDEGGRDPAWYAARALESAIKIISGAKGWTQGGEKGAHNFIDNLASKKAGFIARWQADLLKMFFTEVRNPFGHGPGEAPMPELSPEQTSWAIETAMSWIKMLVRRSGL